LRSTPELKRWSKMGIASMNEQATPKSDPRIPNDVNAILSAVRRLGQAIDWSDPHAASSDAFDKLTLFLETAQERFFDRIRRSTFAAELRAAEWDELTGPPHPSPNSKHGRHHGGAIGRRALDSLHQTIFAATHRDALIADQELRDSLTPRQIEVARWISQHDYAFKEQALNIVAEALKFRGLENFRTELTALDTIVHFNPTDVATHNKVAFLQSSGFDQFVRDRFECERARDQFGKRLDHLTESYPVVEYQADLLWNRAKRLNPYDRPAFESKMEKLAGEFNALVVDAKRRQLPPLYPTTRSHS